MVLARPLLRTVADFTQGPPNTPGLSAVALGVGATAIRSWGTQRGRQYELGHCEAGTMSLDVTDATERLNPANSGSPWNTAANKLLPYRCVTHGAWWNTATLNVAGNLFNNLNTTAVGTTFDPSFEASTGTWIQALVGTPTRATTSAQAHSGTKSLRITCGAAADTAGFRFLTVQGTQYTITAWLWTIAGAVTVTYQDYPGASGTTITTATNTTTGAWERLTLTGVALGAVSAIRIKTAAGGDMFLDDVQAEIGGSATTFTSTGPRYFPIYTGYVERYPQKWVDAGFRGLRPLDCVDALSVLSRTVISQSYVATIGADSPSVIIPFTDTGPPHQILRPDGGAPMLGYTHPGTGGSVNYGGDTFLDQSAVISVVAQNASPPVNTDPLYITYAGTRGGFLSMNPQSFTLEAWVRFVAGTAYFGAGAVPATENPDTEATGPQRAVQWFTGGGVLFVSFNDPNGSGKAIKLTDPSLFIAGNMPPDGVWHYLAITMPGSDTMLSRVDNTTGGSNALGFTPSSGIGLNNFFIDSTTYFGDPVSTVSVAYMAAYPVALSSGQMTAHYQRGIGYLGEVSGARALRILTQYWSSNVVVAAGVASMAPDFSYNGRAVLGVLEEISDTEQGLTWCDTAGAVHVDSRDTRTLAGQTPTFVFGENTAGGELPYLELEYDFDPTYVYSEADLTTYSGTLYKTINAASQTNYGQRILSATIQAATDYQVQQAGIFFTTRYATPKLRISKLILDPAANPQLWTAVLSMEVGTRVTVKRRTSAGVTVSADFFVEQIAHTATTEKSEWTVQLQLSPVFLPTVWILGDSTYGVLGSTTVCAY